ncbi:hypothetical protein B0H63DRAFT_255307 [Podospora didyma]|uniref:Zn(2)-C6 fungal-type domain-containing protein n=1 Tax=Podospora didyma TaxID=330526 RepID=A0AAE0KDR0_9PEZI|nr:hypothetical protein B0H63DRAFT_255307 [Podospora didyma]
MISKIPLWKKHVVSDLQPHVCLMENCKFNSNPLADKRLWVAHLELDHGFANSWNDMTCPLCKQQTGSGKASIVSHHARHLEEISLTIIPTNSESDNESDASSTVSLVNSEKEGIHAPLEEQQELQQQPLSRPISPEIKATRQTCDKCRQQKLRCVGQGPSLACTRCTRHGIECKTTITRKVCRECRLKKTKCMPDKINPLAACGRCSRLKLDCDTRSNRTTGYTEPETNNPIVNNNTMRRIKSGLTRPAEDSIVGATGNTKSDSGLMFSGNISKATRQPNQDSVKEPAPQPILSTATDWFSLPPLFDSPEIFSGSVSAQTPNNETVTGRAPSANGVNIPLPPHLKNPSNRDSSYESNPFDLSASMAFPQQFSFDTKNQQDGLHLVGIPQPGQLAQLSQTQQSREPGESLDGSQKFVWPRCDKEYDFKVGVEIHLKTTHFTCPVNMSPGPALRNKQPAASGLRDARDARDGQKNARNGKKGKKQKGGGQNKEREFGTFSDTLRLCNSVAAAIRARRMPGTNTKMRSNEFTRERTGHYPKLLRLCSSHVDYRREKRDSLRPRPQLSSPPTSSQRSSRPAQASPTSIPEAKSTSHAFVPTTKLHHDAKELPASSEGKSNSTGQSSVPAVLPRPESARPRGGFLVWLCCECHNVNFAASDVCYNCYCHSQCKLCIFEYHPKPRDPRPRR